MAIIAQPGRKFFRGLGVASVLFGCGIVASACGGTTVGIDSNPEISVLVDGQKLSDNTCAHFGPDDTDGVIKQTKKLSITNTGNQGTLCINKITFTPSATKLMSIAYGPKTVDASACPGALASLAPGKSLLATITYAPSPGLKDSATLSIDHNDYKDTGKYTNMCFDISAEGPKIRRDTTDVVFVNPKASSPLNRCAVIGNDGPAPLVFAKLAEIMPASPEYKITSQPNVGDSIAAMGSTENPVNNKATVKICITMTPDTNPDNDQVVLHVYTNDPAMPDASINLLTKYENASSFTVTCQGNDPTQIEYNFLGAGQGTTRTCNVHNDGPNPWAWNNAPTIVAIAPSTQADVDAVYALSMQKNAKERAKPYTAGSVAAGQSVDYTITYTPPTNGLPPPSAKLEIPYKQEPDIARVLPITILSATCDTPTLVFAPDQFWLYAENGKKATGHIVLSNQSCATLDILKACVNNGNSNPPGSDPCASAQYASKYHGLVTAVGAGSIGPSSTSNAANGLFGIDIEFHPPDDNKINADDLLHVVYCVTGSVAGGDCKAGAQTINLRGNTTAGLTLPTATLAVDTATPMSGKPVAVSATLVEGSYPNGKSWRWSLVDRPAGAKAWIDDNGQQTTDPSTSFVPDAKGKYTVQGMGLTVDATDPNKVLWTPPTTVTFTVQ